mmetsp:Transcript_111193/g.358990  ORF Transcript_111193/g.358990 Transcript_111193/m.358990 type:complete len:800 (+) Transcript_111193:191-2590(+)
MASTPRVPSFNGHSNFSRRPPLGPPAGGSSSVQGVPSGRSKTSMTGKSDVSTWGPSERMCISMRSSKTLPSSSAAPWSALARSPAPPSTRRRMAAAPEALMEFTFSASMATSHWRLALQFQILRRRWGTRPAVKFRISRRRFRPKRSTIIPLSSSGLRKSVLARIARATSRPMPCTRGSLASRRAPTSCSFSPSPTSTWSSSLATLAEYFRTCTLMFLKPRSTICRTSCTPASPRTSRGSQAARTMSAATASCTDGSSSNAPRVQGPSLPHSSTAWTGRLSENLRASRPTMPKRIGQTKASTKPAGCPSSTSVSQREPRAREKAALAAPREASQAGPLERTHMSMRSRSVRPSSHVACATAGWVARVPVAAGSSSAPSRSRVMSHWRSLAQPQISRRGHCTTLSCSAWTSASRRLTPRSARCSSCVAWWAAGAARMPRTMLRPTSCTCRSLMSRIASSRYRFTVTFTASSSSSSASAGTRPRSAALTFLKPAATMLCTIGMSPWSSSPWGSAACRTMSSAARWRTAGSKRSQRRGQGPLAPQGASSCAAKTWSAKRRPSRPRRPNCSGQTSACWRSEPPSATGSQVTARGELKAAREGPSAGLQAGPLVRTHISRNSKRALPISRAPPAMAVSRAALGACDNPEGLGSLERAISTSSATCHCWPPPRRQSWRTDSGMISACKAWMAPSCSQSPSARWSRSSSGSGSGEPERRTSATPRPMFCTCGSATSRMASRSCSCKVEFTTTSLRASSAAGACLRMKATMVPKFTATMPRTRASSRSPSAGRPRPTRLWAASECVR